MSDGAVPLDANVHAEAPKAGANGVMSDGDLNNMMQQMMAYLHAEAGKGNLVSMSVVFVDKSGVPQHAFTVKPHNAAVLLGGLLVAEDQIKLALGQSMENHRLRLIKQAEEEAKKLDGAVTQPGNA